MMLTSRTRFVDYCEKHGNTVLASPLVSWYADETGKAFKMKGADLWFPVIKKRGVEWHPRKIPQWAKSFLSLYVVYGRPSLTGYQWAAICRGIYQEAGNRRGWYPSRTVIDALWRWTSRRPMPEKATQGRRGTLLYSPLQSGAAPPPA